MFDMANKKFARLFKRHTLSLTSLFYSLLFNHFVYIACSLLSLYLFKVDTEIDKVTIHYQFKNEHPLLSPNDTKVTI